ncbi:hypothetical protein SLEP1_g59839, partial [Rubroshorea leprosula]
LVRLVHLVIEFLCLELFGLCGLLPKVSQEKECDSSFDVVECDCNKASSNMEVHYDSTSESPVNMYSFVAADRLHIMSS